MPLAYSICSPSSPTPARAQRLGIFRQSGIKAFDDLYTMIERTLNLNPGIPGWERIYGRGIDPLLDPQPGDEFEHLSHGGRACLYEAEGTWVLLILGSAASRSANQAARDDPDENEVVNLISRTLRRLRPIEVFIGPFDRVNRSHHFAADTFNAFKGAGVEVLRHDDPEQPELWFAKAGTDDKFFELAGRAHTHLKTVLKRTTSGKASLVRQNKWFLGACVAPFGLTPDNSRRLIVDERDQAAIALMVKGFADNLSDIDIARRLLGSGLLRRRRGEDGFKVQGGETVPTQPSSTLSRHEKVVREFKHRMLDLAMGKHVLPQKEPASTEMNHPGVRRQRVNGRWEYQFVFDVPDLFDRIDEATLDAALLTVARRVHKAGKHHPSPWIHECEQRAIAVSRLRNNEESVEAREAESWIKGDLELRRAVGAGPEHTRAARVREIVAAVTSAPSTSNPNTHTTGQVRLFTGYPAWSQADEHEYRIVPVPQTYVILRRPADPDDTAAKSLARAWGVGGLTRLPPDLITAQFQHQTFHQGIADAAAAAIESGVPILRGQHAASLGIVDAVRTMQTDHSLRRQALLDDVRDARVRVEDQEDRVLALTRRQRIQRGGETDVSRQIDEPITDEQVDVAVEREMRARARLKELEFALAAFDNESEPARPRTLPQLDDLDVVLNALAWLRTQVTGTTRDAQAIRELIHGLRIVGSTALYVTVEFHMRLPAPDNQWLATDAIRATIPTNGSHPVGYESWSHAYCEELCVRQLTTTHSRSKAAAARPNFDPGELAIKSAIEHLKKLGLAQHTAYYLLHTHLLLPRSVAYQILTGDPIDHAALGTTPEYAGLIRDTYLAADPRVPARSPSEAARNELQSLLNAMKASGRPYWRTADLADFRNLSHERGTTEREAAASKWLLKKRANIDTLVTKETLAHVWRDGKTRMSPAYCLRACPHCEAAGKSHGVDILAWNAEVPGGMLCSACLRTPARDSIEYPAAYRSLLTISDEAPQAAPTPTLTPKHEGAPADSAA